MKQQTSVEKKEDEKLENSEAPTDQVQVEIIDQSTEVKEEKEKKEEEDVKDSWDADSTEDEQEEGMVSCKVIKDHELNVDYTGCVQFGRLKRFYNAYALLTLFALELLTERPMISP